ncbi:Cyclic nucleotide-binding domain-containing protein [Hyphomicrobiales bacterium]|nr:Cyclic nucleotide-binding domain-containing protein [Hyphomicrobiales bacterium]CAH1691720.1 Cyclic nucleotide-binding domain-containing protein [Hyphomicrobiales bacterium]
MSHARKVHELNAIMLSEPVPEDLPILRHLSLDRRTELLRNAMQHSVPAGTVLFRQGEVPNFQLVLMAGSAHLSGHSADGREVLIETARAPDLIIPAAVVTGAPYLMGARVPEPSLFLLIQADAFRAAVAADPLLAQAVIGSLAQQFRRMVRQIKNLKLRSSTERVGCYLLALAARQGTPEKAVLPYEKMLIASELGMTRESFSRSLASLEKSGIRVEGQTILITDIARLAEECRPDPLIDTDETSSFSALS